MAFFCNENLSLHYPLPPQTRWIRDTPTRARALSLTGSIAEDHSMGPDRFHARG
jgi:hypothetical protein